MTKPEKSLKQGEEGGDENQVLTSLLGEKMMGLSEFIGLVGLESNLRLWANKMYSNQQKTGFDWMKEFQKQGVLLEEIPSVLNQQISL